MVVVSILIPVFNRVNFIADCIESALNQNFQDFEIVVVDNASNDGTWEICQEYSRKDPRVRVFQNTVNVGPVRNWQRCAELATGEFSKILFSDDLLEPNCIEFMYQRLKSESVGFVFSTVLLGDARSSSQLIYSNPDGRILDLHQYIDGFINGRVPVSPGAVLLRTADLLKNLCYEIRSSTPRCYFDNGAGPDLMILLLSLLGGKTAVCVSKPLVFFRSHSGSFSEGSQKKAVREGYRSALAYFLKSREMHAERVRYVALEWLRVLKDDRILRNPSGFDLEHDGKFSFLGLINFFSAVLCALKNFSLKKQFSIYNC